MRYLETPEIISHVRTVDSNGDDGHIGDRILGVHVNMDDSLSREGTVQLDLRDFDPKKRESLVIEISLPDLMAALTTATLHRDKSE